MRIWRNEKRRIMSVLPLLLLLLLATTHKSEQWNSTLQNIYDAMFLEKIQNVSDTIPICIPDDVIVNDFNHLGVHVTLNIWLNLNQLVSLVEREQTIMVNMALFLQWNDCRLGWDKDSNLNLTEIRTSVNRKDGVHIFIPEIQLVEGRSDMNFELDQDTDLIIYNTGAVVLEKTITRDVLCNIDVSMYPFDVQSCNLSLVSAYYPLDCLNLTSTQHTKDITSSYTPSDTWDLIHVSRSWRTLTFLREKYSTFVYNVKWRRRPTYELVNLLMPAMLTALISSFIFVTPSGTTDKIGLNLTILLSLFVFTQIMYEKMPETGSTLPLLSQYFMLCIWLVALSCIFSVLSVSVSARQSKRMSRLIRSVVKVLGPAIAPGIYRKVKHALEAEQRERRKQDQDAKQRALIGGRNSKEDAEAVEFGAETENGGELGNEISVGVRLAADDAACKCEPPFDSDSAESRMWLLLATIFDRCFFFVHFSATLGTLVFYLINGFAFWNREKDAILD